MDGQAENPAHGRNHDRRARLPSAGAAPGRTHRGRPVHAARLEAADVLLAVEVVSPDSEARDHDTKPRKDAAAGIPHFWLVEASGVNQRPVVRTDELDPVPEAYASTGVHHDRLKLSAPYDLSTDLSADALDEL